MGFFSYLAGIFTRPADPPPTKPAGSDGVWAPGGFLVGGERARELQGRSKWLAYDNTLANTLTVAAMARIWGALLGGAKWVVDPNGAGGRKAERGADLVRDGLIDAQMPTPWNSVVRKAGFGSKFRGFAAFEQILRQRADGRWVTDRLEHRPQHTIEQWDKPDEQAPWRGFVQRTASGSTYYVSRERLLYVVDDLLGDAPDGVGILRHCTRPGELLERLEQLEGWGFEFSLHGVPFSRAPIKALVNEAMALYSCPVTDPRVKAFVDQQVAFLNRFNEKHAKHPELSLLLESEPYVSGDEKRTPSDVRKWDVEVQTIQAHGQAEVRDSIEARDRQIMRLLGFEWLAMGDGEGARAVHTDKTTMAGLILNGTLEDIGAAATSGPARRIVAMNGLDPDTCAPSVYAEPVPTETIEAVANALAAIAKAGAPLRPQDLAIVNALLDRMRLPNMEEVDPATLMLPRPPAAPGMQPSPGSGAGVPDPASVGGGSSAAKRSRRR